MRISAICSPEVLGSDALTMMDTPANSTVAESPLRQMIENDSVRWGTVQEHVHELYQCFRIRPGHDIQFSANYSYIVPGELTPASIAINSSRDLTGGEHAVRVTKWVIVYKQLPGDTKIENLGGACGGAPVA